MKLLFLIYFSLVNISTIAMEAQPIESQNVILFKNKVLCTMQSKLDETVKDAVKGFMSIDKLDNKGMDGIRRLEDLAGGFLSELGDVDSYSKGNMRLEYVWGIGDVLDVESLSAEDIESINALMKEFAQTYQCKIATAEQVARGIRQKKDNDDLEQLCNKLYSIALEEQIQDDFAHPFQTPGEGCKRKYATLREGNVYANKRYRHDIPNQFNPIMLQQENAQQKDEKEVDWGL